MVPTSDSCGRSTRGGIGGGGSFATGIATTAGGGGRRDGEKIGRSRVPDRLVSGISHSGLALIVRSGAGGGASGGRTITAGSPEAGLSQTDETDGASARRPVRAASKSNPSLGSTEV